MQNYINKHIIFGVSPNITNYIFNVSFLYCLSKGYFILFHPHSHLLMHYSFLSYDKSFVIPQGKTLFEINDNTQMNLKKNNFPILEMESCSVLKKVPRNFPIQSSKKKNL